MMKPIPLLVLTLLAGASFAAAAEPPLELTWQDCARTALENNPGLKAKKLAIEQNKYNYQASYNNYFPSLSVSHSLSRSGSDSSPASNSVSTRLQASEPLLDLKALSSIRSSRITYDQAIASYKAASASLRQALYASFVNLVYAQENVAVQNKVLTIRRHNSELIKLKYDSGMESRGNMMYTAALAEQAKINVAQAERSLNSARLDLLNNMGFSELRPIVAKASLTIPEYTLTAADVGSLLETIPQVVLQEKSVESLKERQLSSKYDLYPTLNASQSLGWSGKSELPGAQSWSLGLSLSLPIFSNGITYYANNTKAAGWALKSGEAALRDLKNTLEGGILNGYNAFLNAKDTALANVSVLGANEERYKESQIQYQAGQLSFIDLETIEQSLVDAQFNQLRYLRDANTSKISLESLLGVGLEVE